MKYQITRLNERLAQATSTMLEGRPDCSNELGKTDSLKEAIEIAQAANESRSDGDGGARIVCDNEQVVMAVAIPLAYESLDAFSDLPAASDEMTLDELNERMDAKLYS